MFHSCKTVNYKLRNKRLEDNAPKVSAQLREIEGPSFFRVNKYSVHSPVVT